MFIFFFQIPWLSTWRKSRLESWLIGRLTEFFEDNREHEPGSINDGANSFAEAAFFRECCLILSAPRKRYAIILFYFIFLAQTPGPTQASSWFIYLFILSWELSKSILYIIVKIHLCFLLLNLSFRVPHFLTFNYAKESKQKFFRQECPDLKVRGCDWFCHLC